jgi:hypothetical protein
LRSDDRLSPEIARYDLRTPERQTLSDADWELARNVAALSEDQLRACVAAGTFDHRAGHAHFEDLLELHDHYAREFPEAKVPIFRPDGRRAYSADWDQLQS